MQNDFSGATLQPCLVITHIIKDESIRDLRDNVGRLWHECFKKDAQLLQFLLSAAKTKLLKRRVLELGTKKG